MTAGRPSPPPAAAARQQHLLSNQLPGGWSGAAPAGTGPPRPGPAPPPRARLDDRRAGWGGGGQGTRQELTREVGWTGSGVHPDEGDCGRPAATQAGEGSLQGGRGASGLREARQRRKGAITEPCWWWIVVE